jgi:hypothetical protein
LFSSTPNKTIVRAVFTGADCFVLSGLRAARLFGLLLGAGLLDFLLIGSSQRKRARKGPLGFERSTGGIQTF